MDAPPISTSDAVSRRAWLLHAALAIAAFAATAAAIRHVSPPPLPPAFVERRAALASRPDVSVVLLGSSRVKHHLDPAVIDAITAQAGRPTRCFNFGIPATNILEMERELRRVLADPPPALRLVVLEADIRPLQPMFGSFRSRDFHTPLTFPDALRVTRAAERPTAADVATLLRESTHNALNVGRWSHVVSRIPRPPEPPVPGGFEVVDPDAVTIPLPDDFLAERERLRFEVASPERVRTYARLYLRMRDLCRARGVGVLLLIGPDYLRHPQHGVEFERQLLAEMPVIRLDHETLPTLYHPPMWNDSAHLTARGARLFSATFARRLLPHLR